MIVGITGKMGAGKTTVSNLFALLGYEVIDVDKEAKKLYFHKDIQEAVEQIIGDSITRSDGTIDFQKIALAYFSSRKVYDQVNALLYPKLFSEIKRLITGSSSKMLVLDAAMLFEIGLDSLCEMIIEVKAPFHLRWKRVKERNPQMLYADFLLRNQYQSSHSFQKKIVIYNDESHSVLQQFEFLVQKYNLG